ncbi:hypothetical protein [Mycobacterium kyogaense]|uniref:hypothetical protein n=1 Tax=Mycobacterium kyogaense TaxID=2212479 RepID=UPI000DAC06D3|nr:hypothetical protein [Mycobacterium kyogaense]
MSRCVKSLLAALIAGGTALTTAPFADAQPTCHEAGSIVRCETNGSVSIKSVPGTRAPNVADQIPRNNNRSGIVLTW